MKDYKLCKCPCHTGKPIFCSCFLPCCNNPRKLHEAQPADAPPVEPEPPQERQEVKFTSFVFPKIRKPFPTM